MSICLVAELSTSDLQLMDFSASISTDTKRDCKRFLRGGHTFQEIAEANGWTKSAVKEIWRHMRRVAGGYQASGMRLRGGKRGRPKKSGVPQTSSGSTKPV